MAEPEKATLTAPAFNRPGEEQALNLRTGADDVVGVHKASGGEAISDRDDSHARGVSAGRTTLSSRAQTQPRHADPPA